MSRTTTSGTLSTNFRMPKGHMLAAADKPLVEGYEVSWPSSYASSTDCADIDDLDFDAIGWSTRDFEALWQARAFARRIKCKAVVCQVAYVQEFRYEINEATKVARRIYVGEREEFS